MIWVRGQYRQAKHGGVYLRSLSEVKQRVPPMAIASLFLFAIGGCLVALASDSITIAGAYEPMVVSLVVPVCAALMVWSAYGIQLSTDRQRLLYKAYESCALDTPTSAQYTELQHLRLSAEPIAEDMLDELDRAYGQLVQIIVADGIAENHELERLARTELALSLPDKRVQKARLQGFLDVYDRAIEDGILTEEEQASIEHIREALGVPERQVRQELAFAKQLTYAREVKREQLAPVQVGVRLRASENAYHATMATQRKRVPRSYERYGERYREYVFEPMQAGNLIVTDKRIAFETGSVKSIELQRIVEVGVHAEFKYVTVHEDKHKHLYYFDAPQPYVTVAYIERLLEQASHTVEDDKG